MKRVSRKRTEKRFEKLYIFIINLSRSFLFDYASVSYVYINFDLCDFKDVITIFWTILLIVHFKKILCIGYSVKNCRLQKLICFLLFPLYVLFILHHNLSIYYIVVLSVTYNFFLKTQN